MKFLKLLIVIAALCLMSVSCVSAFGSAVIFPAITSSSTNSAAQDTRITLTNLADESTYVRLTLISSTDDCTREINTDVQLAGHGTYTANASDLFPDQEGYLIAVAVGKNGIPIMFNNLIGEYHIRKIISPIPIISDMSNALSVAMLAPTPANEKGQLLFDGNNYELLPDTLATHLASEDNNYLYLMPSEDPLSENLLPSASLGQLYSNGGKDEYFLKKYDDSENYVSASSESVCGFHASASELAIVIPTSIFSQPGRVGWMTIDRNLDTTLGLTAGASLVGLNIASETDGSLMHMLYGDARDVSKKLTISNKPVETPVM